MVDYRPTLDPPEDPLSDLSREPWRRGCLAAGAGFLALIVISPFAVVIRSWRAWRRGGEVRSTLETRPFVSTSGDRCRIDLKLDVPSAAEPGFRRRLTDAVVRVAEVLRHPDDVYNIIYRHPADPEPVVLAVGPQLQELGERFSLVLSQGALSGRTVVWLTLGRDRALSEVLDPSASDPEAEGEPDVLLATADARWSMATEWARVGPSLVVRLILVVPNDEESRVKILLQSLT
jgi:hypothetical protein